MLKDIFLSHFNMVPCEMTQQKILRVYVTKAEQNQALDCMSIDISVVIRLDYPVEAYAIHQAYACLVCHDL